MADEKILTEEEPKEIEEVVEPKENIWQKTKEVAVKAWNGKPGKVVRCVGAIGAGFLAACVLIGKAKSSDGDNDSEEDYYLDDFEKEAIEEETGIKVEEF